MPAGLRVEPSSSEAPLAQDQSKTDAPIEIVAAQPDAEEEPSTAAVEGRPSLEETTVVGGDDDERHS